MHFTHADRPVVVASYPTAQYWQASPPVAYLPTAHTVQSARASVPPGAAAAVLLPAGQLEHVAPVALLCALRGRYVPAAQFWHPLGSPAEANFPATHASQADLAVFDWVPTALQFWQEEPPAAAENLPMGQVWQMPPPAAYVPLMHALQSSRASERLGALLPARQLEHDAAVTSSPLVTVTELTGEPPILTVGVVV